MISNLTSRPGSRPLTYTRHPRKEKPRSYFYIELRPRKVLKRVKPKPPPPPSSRKRKRRTKRHRVETPKPVEEHEGDVFGPKPKPKLYQPVFAKEGQKRVILGRFDVTDVFPDLFDKEEIMQISSSNPSSQYDEDGVPWEEEKEKNCCQERKWSWLFFFNFFISFPFPENTKLT